MAAEMTPYDQRAWAKIEKWRNDRLTARTRRLVPSAVRRRVANAGRGAKKTFDSIPGAAQFEELFLKALGGLTDLGARAAMASVRDGAVIEAFRKRGHDVDHIDDIRNLDLREIDKVKPNLTLAYTTTATVEGAAAGFAVSGGEIIAGGGTLLGAGAGAAPGIGMVVGVMAGDAAAVLVGANRAVAHVAAYYGYDLHKPDERLFALAVLGMGTAAEAGKAAAYIEINKLVQALARRATWRQLRQSVVTQVIEKVFARLGFRITQRKLGQAVPVLGTVIGAGMNARLLSSIVDDAEHVYRERFLREKYGLAVDVPDPDASADDSDVVDIVEIVDAELAEATSASSDASRGDGPQAELGEEAGDPGALHDGPSRAPQ